MPTLDRITIYPVKSLDSVDVAECNALASGAIENDRRWRLVDLDGRVVNAKRHCHPALPAGGPGVGKIDKDRLIHSLIGIG